MYKKRGIRLLDILSVASESVHERTDYYRRVESKINEKEKKSSVTVVERKYTTIQRDSEGKVIRGYEGIDMKAVYASKSAVYIFFKRFFDIVISVFLLVILSPVFLITAIAIKVEDGGSVFFTGQRWGKDFKYFPMHKFRSMCEDAEKRTDEVLSDEDKNGMAFKIKDDPRITKVGKFLRNTTIDELPQLWNVFMGDMSLVGPRPIQTTSENGDPYDFQRWAVKPGITCFWQVDGRAEVPWDEWVEMDLRYISEMSFATDIKLLIATVGAVFGKHGAM